MPDITCPKCKATWKARKLNPVMCPRCHKLLNNQQLQQAVPTNITIRGRHTIAISIRVPNTILAELIKRAKTAGIGYTILARHLLQEKLGLPKS